MSSSRTTVPPSPPPPLAVGRRSSGGSASHTGLSKRLSDELSAMLEADDFSIGRYLNKALAVGDSAGMGANDIEIERLMAKVALQLQLETQSCHDEIGRIGAELQAILPRCGADINRLAVGLDGMKDDTSALVESFASQVSSPDPSIMPIDPNIPQESTPSETMKTLSTLHALQLNLEFTKTVLEATSSWDTTMSSIPSLLSNQKLSEAVTALTNLQQGARALRGMPGKEQRDETILKFKTQIETLLKPQLLHAFANIETRINLLHQSHQMYKQLGNLDNFVHEYVKNRPADVHKGWFAFTPTLASTVDADSVTTTDTPKENSFMQFLPQWYQSILTLLSEEKRRTQTVFGNDEASFVTARILAETFRPILSSYKSRLSSIYASDAKNVQNTLEIMNDTSTLSYAGSLQTICDAYEATLQFLSLAYDHIANSNSVGNTTIVSDNDPPHYQKYYIELASPFAPYQKGYSELEFQHSSLLLAKVAKDMHAAVRISSGKRNSITTLEDLQLSIDKLEQLAPSVFSMVEGEFLH